MKNYLAIIIALVLNQVNAQSDSSYTYYLGDVMNIRMGNSKVENTSQIEESSFFTYNQFSPYFQFNTRKGFQNRFELSDFSFNSSNREVIENGTVLDGETINSYGLGIRYSLGKNWMTSKRSKTVIAGNLNTYFNSIYNQPNTENTYPALSQNSGMFIGLSGQFSFDFTKRVSFISRAIYDFAGIAIISNKTENPVIRVDSQRVTSFNIDYFPSFLVLQFGLSVKLN